MDTRIGCSLELIRRLPSRPTRNPALLFVHGAYIGAWCWDVHFLRYFAARGFPSYALSLRGHGASACEVDYASLGIDDYVHDVERTAAVLDTPLVLIGHSMGGLVVTRFLARGAANLSCVLGGVLMAPVPMSGLTPVLFDLALRSPLLLAELNRMHFGQARFDQLANVRRALFSDDMDDALARSYLRRMRHEARKALMEMSLLHLSALPPVVRVPLLVLGAKNDGFFAPGQVTATAHALGADCTIVPDMAHVMMLEPTWREAADRIADWVECLRSPR